MSPSGFATKPVRQRVGAGALAGKPAEAAADAVLTEANWEVEAYGLRDTSVETALAARIGGVLAHTPDFLAKRRGMWGGESALLVEAQGCEAGTVIIKVRKLLALLAWQHFSNTPVVFAFFHRADNTVWIADLVAVLACLRHERTEPCWLDVDSRNSKLAWRMPLDLLRDHLVVDAAAAIVTAPRRWDDLDDMEAAA